jgi:transcriptional regulator with XRE-family HTH domain
MDISVKFGKRVKMFRTQKKMSQGDLAKIFGVHPTYISGIERGVRNMSLKNGTVALIVGDCLFRDLEKQLVNKKLHRSL